MGLDPRGDIDHLDGEVIPPVVAEAEGGDGGHVLGVRGAVLADKGLVPGAAVDLVTHVLVLADKGTVPPLPWSI